MSCTTCSQTNDATAPTKAEKNENDYIQRQFKWEDEHTGNFRRIFPCPGEDKYRPFFTQSALSVFQDTVASRAREEASRMQREENEVNFPIVLRFRPKVVTTKFSLVNITTLLKIDITDN